MGRRFFRRDFLRLAVFALGCVAWPMVGQGASVIIAGNSAVNMTKDDGPRNVTVGFFDDKSGERVGRLQISLMTLGYRHQGVFRVAWKPQVTLTGVTLSLSDPAAGKTIGREMPEALRSIGAAGALLLREVKLEIQQPNAIRIEARTAEFTPAGDLLLLQAKRAGEPDEGAGNFLFRLTGPQAGTVDRLSLSAPRTSNPLQVVTLRNP